MSALEAASATVAAPVSAVAQRNAVQPAPITKVFWRGGWRPGYRWRPGYGWVPFAIGIPFAAAIAGSYYYGPRYYGPGPYYYYGPGPYYYGPGPYYGPR